MYSSMRPIGKNSGHGGYRCASSPDRSGGNGPNGARNRGSKRYCSAEPIEGVGLAWFLLAY
jgi:hypothetical protein